ncbi:uncharacterized protein DS421_20g694470 [Arachis hypogaea]|nr:uncharacterized protein DS421_20g694470 [Arachis hypogaea]
MEDTKRAWHAKLGVARLTHQLLWACHLSKGVWHANSPFQEEPSLWRATWCQRHGTPAQKSHLGMPLGVEGVARQPKEVTWACHLRTQAWHAKLEEFTKPMGVPLEQHGVARWYNNPEKGLKAIEDWACHLSNQAWHANAQRTKSKDWVCHLVWKAWHANLSISLWRAT